MTVANGCRRSSSHGDTELNQRLRGVEQNDFLRRRMIKRNATLERYDIREVDGSDGAVALELEALHALTFWKDAPPIDPESGHWWMARHGNKPVGFAGMSESKLYPRQGYLSRVGVLPAHRGHGLQLRFMRALEARARRNGWSGIVADTRDTYSANNFIKAGYRIFDPKRRWAFPDSIYWRKTFRNCKAA